MANGSDVRRLIADGDLQLAIDRLKALAHEQVPTLYNELILQQARLTRLLRSERAGKQSPADVDVSYARLNDALLSILDELTEAGDLGEAEWPSEPVLEQTDPVPVLANQQILGINNLKQIVWVEIGLRASRSVCRIITPTSRGTGFLVAPGLLMTNHHVIATAQQATQSFAEFNYQEDANGGFLPSVRYQLSGNGFHSHAGLDYTLARVRAAPNKPALDSWGILQLNADAEPVPSEHVSVIQHPNGSYKQIAMTSNWVVSVATPYLRYTTDTMPGSSGSPVFNDSWHVVAIHHRGGQTQKDAAGSVRHVNQGVLMSAIRGTAAAHWPA